jgi:hypothetical protein
LLLNPRIRLRQPGAEGDGGLPVEGAFDHCVVAIATDDTARRRGEFLPNDCFYRTNANVNG